jgi:3-deoxy-D-manno-octulosonic-acid transferase
MALLVWGAIWHFLTPLLLLYVWKRSRKEPVYITHLSERFGGGAAVPAGAIWIHAVSLGEVRAARPLIDALLAKGERILLTNMTAAGRKESMSLFTQAIKDGQLHIRWNPIELFWATRRFMKKHRPKFGMIMEIELWPQLIVSANRAAIPMVMAQAQYPDKSFARDRAGLQLRGHVVNGFQLILAKSERHAERFRHFGAQNVHLMGDLRFEQPIPPAHLAAAASFRKFISPDRPVFCLASTAPDEDEMLIPVLQNLRQNAIDTGEPKPFFVYVPRHPKDFSGTGKRLEAAGLKMLQRSLGFDQNLEFPKPIPNDLDGLFGDSLGEINFYFALADAVFIGDTFNNEGSHNIIEPLSLNKPVVVGPSIWGIEYPALEALDAGVLTKVPTPQKLQDHWQNFTPEDDKNQMTNFTAQHGGATGRALQKLKEFGLIS